MRVANISGVRRTARRRTLRRAALLAAGVTLPLGWLLTAPAQAMPSHGDGSGGAGSSKATVGDAAEAWYASSPIDICTTPLGCPPSAAPSSPYPADTLHVGVAGGQETARTYLQPDLFSLPIGAKATAGTMTLPVDTGSTGGTLSADTAKILACLVTTPFADGTAGSTETPPKTDCVTSAKPVYHASKNDFTLDLTPFLAAWGAGRPPLGIALVPNTSEVSQTDAWHVTINGRKLSGAPHVRSALTFTVPPPASIGVVTPPTAASGPATTAQPPPAPPVQLPPSTTTGAAPAPAPVVASPSRPAAVPVAQQPVAFARPFQYPLAFLAPLALLIGAVFFTRLFTRDATPRRMTL